MPVRSRSEILEKIKTMVGDNADDETLSFVEDVTDTLDDYEKRTKDSTEWETKYKENDEAWRKKYRDRFFGATDEPDEPEKPDTVKAENLTYDNLFKEEN